MSSGSLPRAGSTAQHDHAIIFRDENPAVWFIDDAKTKHLNVEFSRPTRVMHRQHVMTLQDLWHLILSLTPLQPGSFSIDPKEAKRLRLCYYLWREVQNISRINILEPFQL